MFIRILSYIMASLAVGASFLFGHDRVLRYIDRHFVPKRPPVRPARIYPRVIDERTAHDFPPGMIPKNPSDVGFEQRL